MSGCFILAAVTAIDDAGGDIITKRRVREIQEIPGALWHIYDAQDADKIRDLLNLVSGTNFRLGLVLYPELRNN